jgi:hypothetical protein
MAVSQWPPCPFLLEYNMLKDGLLSPAYRVMDERIRLY